MMLPDFSTVAGNYVSLPSLSFNDQRFYVQNSNEDEFFSFRDKLVSEGFAVYVEREISAGSNTYNGNVNRFCTLVSPERYVFMFFDSSMHTCFVTATPPTDLPDNKMDSSEHRAAVSVTQMRLTRSGMSYVVTLADGSFLIVDGGLWHKDDEDELFSFLKNGTEKGKKPLIRLWLITHPHTDHTELMLSLLKNKGKEVEVRAFAHQFPTVEAPLIPADREEGEEIRKSFESVKEELFRDSKLYYLHTGQVIYLPGAELEILSSMDNTFPGLYFSQNDVSVVSRLKVYSGKSLMLLADASNYVSRQLARTYSDYLKSDVMQVAHHGLLGGDIELYKLVDPDICLWPIKKIHFMGEAPGQKYNWCLGEGGLDFNRWLRDPKIRERKHFHSSETVSITMD